MRDGPRFHPVLVALAVLVGFAIFCAVFLVAPVALLGLGFLGISASDRMRRRRPTTAREPSGTQPPQLPRPPVRSAARSDSGPPQQGVS